MRVLAIEVGQHWFGEATGLLFGKVAGVVFGLLLLSATNTVIVDMVAVQYTMGRDGELPRVSTRLNYSGVPSLPLFLACLAPGLVLLFVRVVFAGIFWRSGQAKMAEGSWFTISDGTWELFRTEYSGVPLPPELAAPLAHRLVEPGTVRPRQPDAPVAMMVNGKVLLSVSPKPTSSNHFPTPTTFYEFDPATNVFTSLTTDLIFMFPGKNKGFK